ncbi:MAG: hypothetical protein H3C35_07415 [Bacteroidetes bacterium]|nr:hypothetical protein [Bacteroidota bacterium]
MENPEEYVLKVLRRTHLGLQDSLFPAHAEKLSNLVVKMDQSDSLIEEIQKIKLVNGFAKCALSIEWLFKRIESEKSEPTPEQFESDVLFLNEKIFEAFLNQPFEAPETSDYSPLTNDSFGMESSGSLGDSLQSPFSDFPASQNPLSEPDWGMTASTELPSEIPSSTEKSPALKDALSEILLESIQKISEMLFEYVEKNSNERLVTMAVVRMTAKTAAENARSESNIIGQEFFQKLNELVNYLDKEGKLKTDSTASLMMDIGDRMKHAVQSENSGVSLLGKITEYIHDPKELLKSVK